MTIYFNSLGNNGHLGNQMFQYAALRGIANFRGFNWSIPPSNMFGLHYPLRSSIYQCFKLEEALSSHIGVDLSLRTVEEQTHGFDVNFIVGVEDNTNINGYFQDEKYFRKIKSKILADFTFNDEVIEKASSVDYPDDAVAIHVRRTDYVGNPHHDSVSDGYYQAAMEHFSGRTMYIFSDDTEWCKNNKTFKNHTVSNNDEYVDLFLMSRSRYHIIANSSFSWWGAYLSGSDDVIIPSQWFGPALSHLDTAGYYRKNWKVI